MNIKSLIPQNFLMLGISLLAPSERLRAALLLVSIIVNSSLQAVVLFGILPVIQAIVDPTVITKGRFGVLVIALVGDSSPQSILFAVSSLLIGLVIIKTIYGWVHAGLLARFSARCEVRLSSFMLNLILYSDYDWVIRQNSIRLREIIFGHVVHWSRDFVRNMLSLANDLLMGLMIFAAVIVAYPLAGLVLISILALLAGALYGLVRPQLYRLAERKRAGLLRAHSVLSEAIEGIKDVKIAGVERPFLSMFKERVTQYAESDAASNQWRILPRLVLEFVVFGGVAIVGLLVQQVDLSRGDTLGFIAFFGLATLRVLPILTNLVSSIGTLVNAQPLIEEIQSTIQLVGSRQPAGEALLALPKWSKVELVDVRFDYHGSNAPAVEAVNLELVKGRSYGIVGPSGAGKSTLIDLIVGLVPQTGGKILVDGVVLSPDHHLAWRHHFGYVSQRSFLLDGTVRENVCFLAEKLEDSMQIDRALRMAQLAEVVDRLPQKLDTPLGERGATLSGGQRQRLAIARALYANADTLILDEPTSALDTLVEREILESITTLRGQVTTIIVSHRLGLVRGCDEIWVMEAGRIVARGSHDDLFSSCDLYRRMIDADEALSGIPGRSTDQSAV